MSALAATLPADQLYGRLLATAAGQALTGGPQSPARVRSADGTLQPLPLDRWLGAAGGAALVELDPPGAPTVRTRLRLEAPGVVSEWFGWARVGVDGIAGLAACAALGADDVRCVGGRWLARLRRP